VSSFKSICSFSPAQEGDKLCVCVCRCFDAAGVSSETSRAAKLALPCSCSYI